MVGSYPGVRPAIYITSGTASRRRNGHHHHLVRSEVILSHFGVNDTFGRTHWAPTSDVKKARAQFQEDFAGEK
jgi:hypothetical protein